MKQKRGIQPTLVPRLSLKNVVETKGVKTVWPAVSPDHTPDRQALPSQKIQRCKSVNATSSAECQEQEGQAQLKGPNAKDSGSGATVNVNAKPSTARSNVLRCLHCDSLMGQGLESGNWAIHGQSQHA